MRILVTGSEGFIGKHLVHYLEQCGHKVEKVDRKIGVELHHVQWEGLDAIVHLAAQTSVWNDDRYQIEKDNIGYFMQVVDMSNATGAKLVYASSSCANPENITSLYGLTKMFDEMYAKMYARNAIGLRLHNVYGDNPRKDTLLGRLEFSDRHGQPIVLFNNGINVRHFTFIDNVVSVIARVLDDFDNLKCDAVYNVCHPISVSTSAFADAFRSHHELLEIIRKPDVRIMDKIIQSIDLNLPIIYCDTNIYDGMDRIYGGCVRNRTESGNNIEKD